MRQVRELLQLPVGFELEVLLFELVVLQSLPLLEEELGVPKKETKYDYQGILIEPYKALLR